ncbi:unnamed protein product [Cuscuta epithymum]|uniref:Uncharacterized protein n=1 Tax=Cuscuta epithymum TaxID=186058 RepID=A0AAV0DBY7_9ASTE|nr:unnamed protein product [Cuscuta epithymum]
MAAFCQRNRRDLFHPRLKALITATQKFNHTLAGGDPQFASTTKLAAHFKPEPGQVELTKWRKLDSRTFGITGSIIPSSPLMVLKLLKQKGFEAYLVGGCVRDLILNRIPKDFDVITTAGLCQIKKQFHRAVIVGRRFPICRVHIRGTVVEVSSFDTVSQQVEKSKNSFVPKMPKRCDEKDVYRWRNSMHRDFTINSLFYDPFSNIIYDYANAMADLKSLKLQTLIPALSSFEEDCARILRGMRLAARLNFSFSVEIDTAIRKLSQSIKSLSKSRLMMEVGYMLSYGAAVPSISLLQRYNLLEVLLPFHAAYLSQQAVKQSSETILMLMKLFSSLDQLVSCNRPAHDSLWVALLAFHMSLAHNPEDILVVLTFASVLYHGKWREGVKFARKHAKAAISYAPEISGSDGDGFMSEDDVLAERVKNMAVQVQASAHVLIDAEKLKKMTLNLSGSSSSCLVFISKNMVKTVVAFLDSLVNDVTSLDTNRTNLLIDYETLVKGHVCETRFVLGTIILDTLGLGDALAELRKNRSEKVDKKRKESSQISENDHKMILRKNNQVKDIRGYEIIGEDRGNYNMIGHKISGDEDTGEVRGKRMQNFNGNVSKKVSKDIISHKKSGDEDGGEEWERRKMDCDSSVLGSGDKKENSQITRENDHKMLLGKVMPGKDIPRDKIIGGDKPSKKVLKNMKSHKRSGDGGGIRERRKQNFDFSVSGSGEKDEKKMNDNFQIRDDHKMLLRKNVLCKDLLEDEIFGKNKVSQKVIRNTVNLKRSGDEDGGEVRGRKQDLNGNILGPCDKVEKKMTLHSIFKRV